MDVRVRRPALSSIGSSKRGSVSACGMRAAYSAGTFPLFLPPRLARGRFEPEHGEHDDEGCQEDEGRGGDPPYVEGGCNLHRDKRPASAKSWQPAPCSSDANA